MSVLFTLFWLLLGLLFFSYVGYGLVVLLLIPFRRKRAVHQDGNLPQITLVIPCYNEAGILHQKITNSLELDYPPGKLSLLVVADGSSDDTLEVLKGFTQIRVLYQPQRAGKTAALNRAMKEVETPLVVFSDANTLLNKECLLELAKHFADAKVGAVAGEKKILHSSGMGFAEGWYWMYESYMKTLDARFYSVLSAAGELVAMRTALYEPMDASVILDDLVLSINICLRGYTIAYEPKAFAMEAPSRSLGEEEKRKVRIAAGAFQSLKKISFTRLMRFPALTFQFFCRRWLRWVVCPPAILIVFIINVLLVIFKAPNFYTAFLYLQLACYFLSFIGWLLIRKNKAFSIATVPFYFLFMNYCMMAGWVRSLRKEQTVLWEKAER